MEEEKNILEGKEKQLAAIRPHQVKKGQVLNPKGKTKGTLNKITQETRLVLAEAAQQNLPAVNHAIQSLLTSDNDFVRSRGVELYLRLLKFSHPELQAVKVEGDGSTANVIVIGKPTDLILPEPTITDLRIHDVENNTIDVDGNE